MAAKQKATMDFLKSFNKELEKMPGVSTTATPPKYWFGFGNHALNKIMSGSFYRGIPQGRITALCGPSGAGKSYLAGNVCKQAQSEGAHVLVVDSENALDDTFMEAIGVDTKNSYSYVSPMTITQTVKIISSFIKGYRDDYGDSPDAPPILIVIDSLDMLMTEGEAAHYAKGDTVGDQGQHPRQLKAMLRTFVQDIKQLNISMVVTKQVYKAKQDQLLAGEGIWVINDAIRYACSQIVLVTKLKLKDATTKEVSGIRLKAESFKTRFSAPFQQITLTVPYTTGVNPYSGVFDIAKTLGVIIQQGSWYTLEGSDTKLRAAEIEDKMMEEVVRLCEAKRDQFLKILELDDEVEDTSNETVTERKKATRTKPD